MRLDRGLRLLGAGGAAWVAVIWLLPELLSLFPELRASLPSYGWWLIFGIMSFAICLAALGAFYVLPCRVPAIATYLMVLAAYLLLVMATTGLLIAVPAMHLETGTPWLLACLLLLMGFSAMGVVAICYAPTRLIGLSLLSIGVSLPVSLYLMDKTFGMAGWWGPRLPWFLLPSLAWMALALGLVFSRSTRITRRTLGWSVIPWAIAVSLSLASYLVAANFPGFAAQSRAEALLATSLPQAATNVEVTYSQVVLFQGEVRFNAPPEAVQAWLASGVACFSPNWQISPEPGKSITSMYNSCFGDGWYFIRISPAEDGLWSLVLGRDSD
jgi:hypothetical protein